MEPRTPYFHDKTEISLSSTIEKAAFHYTLDGTEPTIQSPTYSHPFDLQKTTVVKAALFQDGKKVGRTIEREYVKIPPATK
jgi:N-acetyl-beta-hexosaminidase